MAPDGHMLLIVDESQIECRLLEYWAEETEAIEDFRQGRDPYCSIASKFYRREITKADKAERGTGKQIRLSCGYGAGGPSIVATSKRGTYGTPVILTDAEGLAARDLYRSERPGVVRGWKEGDQALSLMAGPQGEWEWRMTILRANGDGSGSIELPNGCRMLYTLQWAETRNWQRRTRKGWKRIWGGVVTQNLMEGFARAHTGEAMLRLAKSASFMHLAWMAHDELIYVVPESEATDHLLQYVCQELSRPPAWAPDIPLAAEGMICRRYEK